MQNYKKNDWLVTIDEKYENIDQKFKSDLRHLFDFKRYLMLNFILSKLKSSIMKTLTETCAEVSYDEVLKAVEVQWKGFADTEQFKRVLEHALLMMRDYRCSVWISNMEKGKAVPKEAMEWLKNIFIPRTMQSGVKKMGFLVTGNAFGKLYAANLKSATKQLGIDMNYFDSRKELENWIFS
jgi:hypothetical protein